MKNLKDQFLLDPRVHFLNHGSFGATPSIVLAAYQEWQRRLEHEPVRFLAKELPGLLAEARACLAAYLHIPPSELVFIPNATFGVNAVARSLHLEPGDEVLASDHEYGACDKTWDYLCNKAGAHYRHVAVRLPATPEEMINQLWAGVTERTKAIFVSHITSPTAQTFPVGEICTRARQAGILTLIDGAHAPGQIPLDLAAIGADFYTGNCHKWLMAPKGAAFLYAGEQAQALLEPLIVSWGWQAAPDFTTGSAFIDHFQWLGTHDPSVFLAVPAALKFMQDHDWEAVRAACHRLLVGALDEINAMTDLPPLYPGPDAYAQMAVAELPALQDLPGHQYRLYETHRVQVPLIGWNERTLLRLSVQAYNTQGDVDALLEALTAVISR